MRQDGVGCPRLSRSAASAAAQIARVRRSAGTDGGTTGAGTEPFADGRGQALRRRELSLPQRIAGIAGTLDRRILLAVRGAATDVTLPRDRTSAAGAAGAGQRIRLPPGKLGATEAAATAEVAEWLSDIRPVDPDEAIAAVFDVLNRHLSAGQLAKIRNALPRGLRLVWDGADARILSEAGA